MEQPYEGLRELSLFTGVGGGLLGTTLLGFKHIGYVEWSEYCQRVLALRIKEGYLDEAPIFSDIRSFISEGYAECYKGVAQIISAGFPCQPFALNGKRQGESDERNMWEETIECVRIIRPRFVWLENSAGIISDPYFGRVLGDLAESGYSIRYRVLSAAECGAPHKRDRLWLLADSERCECGAESCEREAGRVGRKFKSVPWNEHWKDALTRFRGMDDGLAGRVAETDAIRNGQVPAVVREAFVQLWNG